MSPTQHNTSGERLAKLEERTRNMERRLDVVETNQDKLIEMSHKQKGVMLALATVGGTIAGLASVVVKLLLG